MAVSRDTIEPRAEERLANRCLSDLAVRVELEDCLSGEVKVVEKTSSKSGSSETVLKIEKIV